MSEENHNIDDLPELEEIPELPVEASDAEPPAITATAPPSRSLPGPPEKPQAQLRPLEVDPEPAVDTSPGASASPVPEGASPPLRVLDKAPTHLRLAALIVGGGALLPFMGLGDASPGAGSSSGLWFSLGGKLIVLGGAWLWLQQVLHDFGPKARGFVGRLADLQLRPKKKELVPETKPKRPSRRVLEKGPGKLEHPFPTGLHLVSALVVGCGIFLCLFDERSSFFGPLGLAELLMFLWASFTWVHIARYERWGGFNPLFPLMFLGMFFAGVAQMLTVFTAGDVGLVWKVFSGLGGAVVAAGGGLAAFTIVEAMVAAKKEGDRKKADALEARRAARANRSEK
ncbi:MAG: hypothetical protein CMJ89_02135 [Planctomycetes bacterium]|jgi:hypothetical protein|nr:hypothetical protein [Planctomycetota bacterium]